MADTTKIALVNADAGAFFSYADTVEAAQAEIVEIGGSRLEWRQITRREFDSLETAAEGARYEALAVRGEELTDEDETVGYWLAVEAA